MNRILLLRRYKNQFAVTIDPQAKKVDKSDMDWCFIDDTMEKEAFRAKYPNATSDPVNDSSIGELGSWYSEKTVRISEYFTREPVIREIALLSDGRSVWMDELEPIVDELLEVGVSIVRTRKSKTHKVMWRKITGLDVLEGPVELKVSTIPVVPVWGEMLIIKKRVIYSSIIRHAKDAQRMANFWDSASAEKVALAPKAPYIGAEGHFEGRETEWENANTKNYSSLTYVPQYQGDPGPRRERGAEMPAAEITLGAGSTDKIKATLGLYDASVGCARKRNVRPCNCRKAKAGR